MKKNFGIVAALMILSAFGSAFADFKLEVTAKNVYELSQVPFEDCDINVDNNGDVGSIWCSGTWIGYKNGPAEVLGMRDYIQNNVPAGATLVLASNLTFGGANEAGECIKDDANLLFAPLHLKDYGNVNFRSKGTETYVVKGACYEVNTPEEKVGFFEVLSDATIENVAFREIQMSAKGKNPVYAGVIAGEMDGVQLKNVKVAKSNVKLDGYKGSSTLEADAAKIGVVAGRMSGGFNASGISVDTVKVIVENTTGGGNVYGGCLVGFWNVEGVPAQLTNSRILTCSIDVNRVTYSGLVAGAIDGETMNDVAGEKKASLVIQNVEIPDGNMKVENGYTAFAGGIAGTLFGEFEKVLVDGVLFQANSASVNAAQGTVTMGGLFGDLDVTNVEKTYILSTGYVGSGSSNYTTVNYGYLVGKVSLSSGSFANKTFIVTDNYYQSSEVGLDGIGNMSVFGTGKTWNEGVGVAGSELFIGNNYRNAPTGTDPTVTVAANIAKNKSASNVNPGNGTLSANEMKTDAFAYLLNWKDEVGKEDVKPLKWMRRDGRNRNFPILVPENVDPEPALPHEVTLSFACVSQGCLDQLNATDKSKVEEDLKDLGMSTANGYVVAFYTDFEGKISSSEGAKLKTLVTDLKNGFVLKNGLGNTFSYDVDTRFTSDVTLLIKSDIRYVKYFIKQGDSYIPMTAEELQKNGMQVSVLQSELPSRVTSSSNAMIPNFVLKTDKGLNYLSLTGISDKDLADANNVNGNSPVTEVNGNNIASFGDLLGEKSVLNNNGNLYLVYESGKSKLENNLYVYVSEDIVFSGSETLPLQLSGYSFNDLESDNPEPDAPVFETVSINGAGKANGKKMSLYPFMKIGNTAPKRSKTFGYRNSGWRVFFSVEPNGDVDKLYENLMGAHASEAGDVDARVKNLFETASSVHNELEVDQNVILEMNPFYKSIKKYLVGKNSIDNAIYGIYILPEQDLATYTVSFNFDDILKNKLNSSTFVSDKYIANAAAIEKKMSQIYTLNSADDDAKFLDPNELYIYRTANCYDGKWLPSNDYNGLGYDNFAAMANDVDFVNALQQKTSADKPFGLTLYPHATSPCNNTVITLKRNGDGTQGTVSLKKSLNWNGKDTTIVYEFTLNQATQNYELEIPVSGLSDVEYTFTVVATPAAGYKLAEKDGLVFSALNEQDRPLVDGASLSIKDIWKGMAITANFAQKISPKNLLEVVLDLDELQKAKEVFYVNATDRVTSFERDKNVAEIEPIVLPTGIYTVDQCLDSWNYYSAANAQAPLFSGNVINESDWMLLKEAAQNDSKIVLLPKWKEASECSDEYNQWTLAAEHGSVKMKEISGSGSQYHEFDSKNQMLMPKKSSTDFWVETKSESGYKSEPVEFLNNNGIVLVSLKNGEKLSSDQLENIVKVHAEFLKNQSPIDPDKPVNPTAPLYIVNPSLEISGNVIRLSMTSNKFGVKSSEAQISIRRTDKPNNSKSFMREVPKDGSLVYGDTLSVGSYAVSVVLKSDGETSEAFERNFEVKYDVFETVKEDWQMLSLAMVDFEGVNWNNDMEFFWWDETSITGSYWQYRRLLDATSVDPVRGYWYSSMKGNELKLRQNPVDARTGEWNLLHVYKGWNLVANPYGWYVELENGLLDEDDVQVCHWNAKAGDYVCSEKSLLLKPYEAVWIKIPSARNLLIPSEPVFVAYVDANDEIVMFPDVDVLKKSSDDDWSVVASLADKNGKMDSGNILGISSRDVAAEEPPAGMGSRVNLSIVEDKRLLNKSLKKKTSSDVYEWDVEMSATSDRAGYLNFEGIAKLKSRGFGLYVTIDGNTVEMNDGESLKVSLNTQSKKAKVRITKSAPVKIAKRLDGLRALNLGNALEIRFNATAALAGTNAKVELLNLKGEIVAHGNARTANGMNLFRLNAPKTGAYVLRVIAGGQVASGKVLVK